MGKLKYTVEVTESGIKSSARALKKDGENRSSKCPVARAIKKLGLRGVVVGRGDVLFTRKGIQYIAELPARVRKFIDNFDDDKTVKAFSFTLTAKPRS